MSPLGKFILRFTLYGAVLGYIAADLWVFHGPLRQRINLSDPDSAEARAVARSQGVVARVFNHQITRSQLERALRERLWAEGKVPEALPPAALKTARYAALNDLLDHELLRVKAKAHATSLKVSEEEIRRGFDEFLARFASKEAMVEAMKSQGIASESDLRDRIAARIQQEKYVELKIAPLSAISEQEAREWFEQNKVDFALPERIEARHVFLPTLTADPDAAREKLEAALAELNAGTKDFDALVAGLSEDPASKGTGGKLGWMTRERVPADFSTPVFAMETGKPGLIRTHLGWHLVEVLARKAPEPRSFEDVRTEVMAALGTVRRDQAVRRFRDALRQFEAAKIDVYHDMMDF